VTMHRYFDISRAQRDLKYQPVQTFEQAWPETLQWFKQNWLPQFLAEQQGKKKSD